MSLIQTLVWDENISLGNVERFELLIEKLLEGNSYYIILNLKQVSYMNSRALGILVNAVEEAESRNKEFVIVNNQPTVLEIFGIFCFYSFVRVFRNVDEAEAYFNKIIARTTRKIV